MRKAAEAGRERATAAREAVGERIDAAREATGERVDAAKAVAGERVEAAKAAAVELQEKVKPKLRGVIHEYSFPVSLLAGGLLVYFASGGRERLALAIYAISLSALLGTSALYHRVNWRRPGARMWMRRLDHSMIFLLIAGTVTPFALLVVPGALGTALLIAVWAGAAAGIAVELLWTRSPKWVSVAVYLDRRLDRRHCIPLDRRQRRTRRRRPDRRRRGSLHDRRRDLCAATPGPAPDASSATTRSSMCS